MIHSRLGCSTISFRYLGLEDALASIREIGFTEIDLGALPGVCDHVPYELDGPGVDAVARTLTDSGLRVRSINGDIGDLNHPLDAEARAATGSRVICTEATRPEPRRTSGRARRPTRSPAA